MFFVIDVRLPTLRKIHIHEIFAGASTISSSVNNTSFFYHFMGVTRLSRSQEPIFNENRSNGRIWRLLLVVMID